MRATGPRTAITCLLLASAACGPPSGPPDLVLVGGRVFTADTARPWAEAVAIRGDRIAAVGRDAEVRRLAGPDTRVLDLGGRVVVPGLTDAHVHPRPSAPGRRLAFEAAPVPNPSRDELAARLRGAVAEAGPGEWVEGEIGEAVLDDSAVDRDWLDRLAPRHPVQLSHYAGHGLILNSAALRELGITEETRDPPGGSWGRAPDTGRLDGRAYEYAIWNEWASRLREVPTDTAAAAFRAFGERAARWGITSAHTMGTFLPLGRLLEALAAADAPIRFTIYRLHLPRRDVAEAWEAPVPEPASSRIRVAGMKWILDGAPPDRGAALRDPYADRPGWRGRVDFPPEDIRRILARALESDERLALHISGDSTAALVLRLMRKMAPAERWRAERVRFEHGDGLAPDLLPLADSLGVVLVQNPLHLASPVVPARYGPERMGQAQPLRSALAAGIPLALGSDEAGGPAENPWLNVLMAVTDPNRPSEALTREQAILAYTRGGAFAEGREAERGTIAPGMLADLAVLSADPFEVPAPQLPGVESILTLVGGQGVWDAGVLGPVARPAVGQ
ncbi:MAG TPA: amidohydrolase [Gemmatimonadota bacterium]|nr:amidohydrolase [Gemmatimonadota bacterium]